MRFWPAFTLFQNYVASQPLTNAPADVDIAYTATCQKNRYNRSGWSSWGPRALPRLYQIFV